MRSVGINSTTWTPLSLEYANDTSIQLKNTLISNKDNVNFVVTPATSGGNDIKINNYSELILTNPLRSKALYDFNLVHKEYPKQYTTYLLLNSYPNIQPESSYLMIQPEKADLPVRQFITRSGKNSEGDPISSEYFTCEKDNNNIYFSITMHDQEELSISHDDNFTTTYLTTSGTPADNTLGFMFSAAPLDIPRDDQRFNYITQNKDGYLLLFKFFNSEPYYIMVDPTGMGLIAIKAGVNDQTYPLKGVIRTVPQVKSSKTLTIDNAWVSYKTIGNQNNLNINTTKSFETLNNNYLLTTQYSNITGSTIPVDIIPLKNQLTPSNRVMRGNPFPNYNQCDHRQYNKIFSGTNQQGGYNNILMSYDSYQTEIQLEPDAITYFNTPQDMYPCDKLNINDSGLIEAGAIGGDTPIVSDKIFKKAADYKYNTPYGAPSDEETGVWLCSWLKSNIGVTWDEDTEYNEDIVVNFKGKVYRSIDVNKGVQPNKDARVWFESGDSKPIWVDRYYNPAAFSAQEALKVENQYSEYVSKYEYIINTLSAEDIYVFDKISDLTFEPGCAYAYYRVGPVENQVTIDNIERLVHEGQAPVYDKNRSIKLQTGTDLTFDSTRYIETVTLANTKDSSCTVSFNIESLDWTKPFASQIIGNYVNEGISFYNKLNTTPYIILPGDNDTVVYNSDMIKVLTIPQSAEYTAHGNGSENILLLCKESGKYIVHQYDLKGMLVESTHLTDFDGISALSMFTDERNMYVLDDSDKIKKYSADSEFRDYLFRKSPAHVVGGPDHDINIEGHAFPVSDSTFIHVHGDDEYRINCDSYTIDMDNSLWFTKGDIIYKYIPSDRRGANATFSGVVNGGLISLLAEEFVQGSMGNTIKIVGDGVSTIAILVVNWNNAHPDNRMQIVDPLGSSIVPPNEYEIQLSGGIDIGQPITFTALSASAHTIQNIRCDYDNNIWVLGHNNTGNKIWKFDNNRNKLIDINVNELDSLLVDVNSTIPCRMDMICEFVEQTGYTQYITLIHKSNSNQIIYTKIDLNGSLISTELKDAQIDDLNRIPDITNFETCKSLNKGTINTNHIIFKMRYQSYFDTDKTYPVYIKYNIEDLTPGRHHFAIGFNSDNANISLFVDGNLYKTIKSDDIFTGAAYKFTKTIHAPLHVGSDTFFNNILLGEHLGILGLNYASGNTIDNIRVFNKYLNFYKIKSLTRETKNILPLTLTLPTGKRSYLDKIQKYYRHRTPGRRSDTMDIDIIPEDVQIPEERKNKLTTELRELIVSTLPVNKQIREVNWINE
jgi:hypothetical protein